MRKHDVGNVGNAFRTFRVLLVNIVAVDQFLFGFHGADRLLIDDSGTGAVDQHRAFLHERKKLGVDHAARGVVFRNVETDDIRLRENFFHGAELDAEGFRHVGGKNGVERENGHIETGNPFCKQSADIAETENAEGLAGNLMPHEFGFLPFSGTGGFIGGNKLAVCGKSQSDDLLRNSVGIGAGSVHDIDVAASGIFCVDIVVAGACADHQFELGKLVHHFRSDFFASDNDDLSIGIFLCKIKDRLVGNLDDFESGVGQDLGDDLVQFCRDKNFLHEQPPYYDL